MDETGLEDLSVEDPLEHTQEEALFDGPPSPTRPPAAAAPLALYRRYRPDTFADVIGQEHVTEPLQRALTNNRVNHAYLFSGPRGCGKTTSARILARALNCELGPRAEPCGQCRSCRDLARGGPGSIDVIEIDAASHGGVDDARDLRERAFFAPVASRYKIYIVDEAHMVTTAGFNALLKLVEEPPPHVKFIFATTEPDKVIGTIRSRTHHYPFRLVPPRMLIDYLGRVCAEEGIAVEPAVLPLVVRAGAGSVRDSLSVLDQLLGGASEAGVAYRQATALLGYTPDSLLDEFVDAFAAGDAAGVFSCVDKVIEVGQDPRRFAEDLLRRLRDLVIVAAVPDALSSGLVEVADDQAERLSSQAAALGPGELTRAAEVIATGLTDMRGTTAPRLHLELMCARVLLPGADVDARGVHARLDRIERRLGVVGEAAPAPSSATPRGPSTQDEGQREPSAVQSQREAAPQAGGSHAAHEEPRGASADQRPAQEADSAPSDWPKAARPGEPAQPPVAPPERASQPQDQVRSTTPAQPPRSATAAPGQPGAAPTSGSDAAASSLGTPQLTVTDVRRLWPDVLEEVKGKRRFTWILLSQNAQVAELRGRKLLLAMSNLGARDSFARGGSEDVLREAIVEVLGADFVIETMVDPSATPGGAPARPHAPEPPTPEPPSAYSPPAEPHMPEPHMPGQHAPGHPESPPSEWAPREPAGDAPPTGQPAPGAAPQPEQAPSSTAPPAPPPVSAADQRSRDEARQKIRPTRRAGVDEPHKDDRDAAARRDDSDLDELTESHTELLARHLGAEIIAEEELDA